jgi:hypothetical protein
MESPEEGKSSACGMNCVKQEGTEGICSSQCLNKYHYKNNSVGRCELIQNCTDRNINININDNGNDNVNNVEKPCGEGCVKQVIAEGLTREACGDECYNTAHFIGDDNGVCVLKSVCQERIVNPNSYYVCGNGCYEEEETHSCDTGCVNKNHYYGNERGICVEYERCEDRKVYNNETRRVCGSGNCYASETKKEDDDTCVKACDNPRYNYDCDYNGCDGINGGERSKKNRKKKNYFCFSFFFYYYYNIFILFYF